MAERHISEKYRKKLEAEGILDADKDVRFTVTFLDPDGKLLGRDWHKGELVLSRKRIALLAKQVKFLNIKCRDERFSQFEMGEDNPVCLKIEFREAANGRRKEDPQSWLVFHIYTSRAGHILEQLKAL